MWLIALMVLIFGVFMTIFTSNNLDEAVLTASVLSFVPAFIMLIPTVIKLLNGV